MRLAGFLAAVALFAGGCATSDAPLRDHLRSEWPEVRECAQWFRDLDDAIDAAGVRDVQYARIAGFPYLRTDRLHASLRERAAGDPAVLRALVDRQLELDLDSRALEIQNLPRERMEMLPGLDRPNRAQAQRRTSDCARMLRDADFATPEAPAQALERMRVPDDYLDGARLLGLYPLTRLAFMEGIRRWQSETAAALQREPVVPQGASLVRYAPPVARGAAPLERHMIAGMIERAELNPLGLPVLPERDFAQLAAAFAPTVEVAITGDFDRFGALRLMRGSRVPVVDASAAAVYVHPAYTRYGERILLQVVYTLWFPERPAESASDLLSGRLDGLVWRVTLAPDGEPLLYDSIHPCGCYHQFFPSPRARVLPAPDALEEWAFVPSSLGAVGEGDRVVVRIAPRTHYIEQVRVERGADSVVRYELRPYDELRSMQDFEGGQRSVFGPDGLVPGTERAERYLFWPMGIASAGAMRQWGHQPTAFVGRRHFDDPDLIERRFALDLAGSAR